MTLPADLEGVLGSRRAARLVRDWMSTAYRRERRKGRTEEEAQAAALAEGEWWLREMLSGGIKWVDDEHVRPSQPALPSMFIPPAPSRQQKLL